MEYVKIKWSGGSYGKSGTNSSKMSKLALFLVNDVEDFRGYFSFKDWIASDPDDWTGGNISFLRREGSDILVGYQYDDYADENAIKMPQKELIAVLDRWDELISRKAQEIIITRDGDTFTVEGHGLHD